MHRITTSQFLKAATFCLIATCLVLPLSTPLLSLFSILTLLFWLFSGRLRTAATLVVTDRIVLLATLLLLLFIIGVAYSSASLSESLQYLRKYRELFFFPVVYSLLHDHPQARKKCEVAFLAGCGLLLLSSFCMYLGIVPQAKYGNSLLYHITHSFFMSILAFYAAHKCIDCPRTRVKIFWAVLFLLCFINMFYIAPGRTGMLVFLFLMVLFFSQRLSWLMQAVSLGLFIIIMATAFFTSDNFSSRSRMAFNEIQAYEYGAARTSMGQRFDWWVDTIQLIRERPLFGHGTGSFPGEHDRLIAGTKIMKTDNPHNEYLLIGEQLGLLGLATFVLLFLAQLFYSFRLEKPNRLYVQGIVIAMMIGCIANSFLFDSHQGHFWAILSSVYLSAYSR